MSEDRTTPVHAFEIAALVRANSEIYDKRISALTDLFHQTQLASIEMKQVTESTRTELRQALEHLRGRIDGGISPTMQKIKEQNEQLDKDILRLENKMITMINELGTKVAVMDEHYSAPLTDWKEFQANLRSFFFKVIGAAMMPAIVALITMYFWMQEVKDKIQSMPAAFSVQHHERTRTP